VNLSTPNEISEIAITPGAGLLGATMTVSSSLGILTIASTLACGTQNNETSTYSIYTYHTIVEISFVHYFFKYSVLYYICIQ
jgi:hypothetical protein